MKEQDAINYLKRIQRFVNAQPFSEEKKKFLMAHPFMIPDHILEEWEQSHKGA